MKYFYLKFTEEDFIKDGSVWRTTADPGAATPTVVPIDLRNNLQYKNYSVHKSKYGLNLIGDQTWTGMNQYDIDEGATPTSSGFVENNRFVDTKARVDVTQHYLNVSSEVGDSLDYTTKFYTSNFFNDTFPDLWESKAVARGRNIQTIDTDDYAVFEIKWHEDFDTTGIEFEYIVEVQIADTLVDAMHQRTRSILDVFPEWMALKDDSIDPDDPFMATPNSVGGALINAVAGDTIEDLRVSMLYLKSQMFLTTANDAEKAWIYVVEDIPDYIFSIKGDGIELARATNAREFYMSSEEDDVVFFMNFGNILWLNKKYDEILVNGEEKMSDPVHVWNWFDEHGLLFDLKRHHLETNDSFRKRILDIFINLPGVSLERVKLSLRRELNLWLTYGATPALSATPTREEIDHWLINHDATPDSQASGATPTIIEMDDIHRSEDYFDPDGMPTEKMRELVLWLSENYPTTWGFFRWGNALWDTGGLDNTGYNALPYRFDAESATPVPLDAGVGDLDDLYVYRPDEIELTTTFDYNLQIKGLWREIKQEHRSARMDILVSGKADISYYLDRAQADITVWVTADGITYWTNTTLDSGELRSLNPITGTDRAEAEISLFDQNNNLSKQFDWGIDGSDAIVYSLENANEDIEISAEDITDIAVSWGWDFDLSSTNPDNGPDAGYGYLVFSEDATPNTLPANSDGTRLHAVSMESDIIRLIPEWDNSDLQTETKLINTQTATITMNGGDNNSKMPAVFNAPLITFPNMTVEASKAWQVEILSINNDGEGVAYSADAEGNAIEIPRSNINLNGNNSWVDNIIEIEYGGADRDLIFTTIDEGFADYPSDYEVWHNFSASSIETYQGVVDENGAWLGGVRPDLGQTNEKLRYHVLNRDDFLLDSELNGSNEFSNTDDFIPSWIGIEYTQGDSVVAYLNSNTVKPAEGNSELTYPNNAIVEAWDEDDEEYAFSEFFVYAKKIQRANPQWNPFINSGWMFDKSQEYYFYAEKREEAASTPSFELEKQSNLGAPIIIKTDEATPQEFRQVAFIEDYATPNLTFNNIEAVMGNGTNELYLSYADVFDVSVVNTYTKQPVTDDTESSSSVVTISEISDFDVEYDVTYKVNNSFIADHNFVSEDGDLTTHIDLIESTPFGGYTVVYEGSEYNYATPVDVPLNPAYTLREEGFIFVCFDEFGYSFVQIKLSPGNLASTSEDYALISLISKDEHGNSKANQTFELTTDGWGELSKTTVVTDKDGYAFSILTGEDDTSRTSGEIIVSKDGSPVGSIGFGIGQIVVPNYKLVALPSANSMPADGTSINFIFGRVLAPDDLPVPHAVISYRRGVSIEDLFAQDYLGQTIADSSGRFTIGPIVAGEPDNPRAIFYAVESWNVDDASPSTPGEVATPSYNEGVIEFGPIGDVVYWREFPSVVKALNEYNQLSTDNPAQNQHSTSFLSNDEAFPVGYDEATPTLDATPNLSLDWTVPEWYAISAYKQYQLGFRGDDYYEANYYFEGSHPDYEEF